MDTNIEQFKEQYPSRESYWRSIILFGRNVASYKFALAESLLEIAPTGQTEVTLEELAEPYSRHICEHIEVAPKQATSRSSFYLDSLRKFNEGEIEHDEMIDTTVARGFNNVIDAFHVVNNEPIPMEFFQKDYSKTGKKIILTDELFRLAEEEHSKDFHEETESRWNLVETAWELGVSRNLLNVGYDGDEKVLYIDRSARRKDVTSARSALNGYQKGKCFYCFADITVTEDERNTCDVDHFYPHLLQDIMRDVNMDGVWNLTLACPVCNRGANGKFAKVPAIKYLERLYRRNEFLISSHHPLRETIMNQTGSTERRRRAFLQTVDNRAINALAHRWETPEVAPPTF